MKKFSCGDVVPGCSAHFHGASDEEILVKVGEHARADHGLTEVSVELVEAVRRRIQPVQDHA